MKCPSCDQFLEEDGRCRRCAAKAAARENPPPRRGRLHLLIPLAVLVLAAPLVYFGWQYHYAARRRLAVDEVVTIPPASNWMWRIQVLEGNMNFNAGARVLEGRIRWVLREQEDCQTLGEKDLDWIHHRAKWPWLGSDIDTMHRTLDPYGYILVLINDDESKPARVHVRIEIEGREVKP